MPNGSPEKAGAGVPISPSGSGSGGGGVVFPTFDAALLAPVGTLKSGAVMLIGDIGNGKPAQYQVLAPGDGTFASATLFSPLTQDLRQASALTLATNNLTLGGQPLYFMRAI
jgi:hypothetical protein